MPENEMYFGLGDKTSLNLRDHAYTLWNTDVFGWQESTDPLYKAIPFFIAMKAGNPSGASAPPDIDGSAGPRFTAIEGYDQKRLATPNQEYCLKCHVYGGDVTVYFDGPTMPEMVRILIERA